MSILFVINQLSGNSDKVNPQALVRAFPEDKADFFYIRKPSDTWSPHGYDKIAVVFHKRQLTFFARAYNITNTFAHLKYYNQTA